MTAAYFPAMQSTQVASLVAAVTAEALPVGHDWHVAEPEAPLAAEYLPPAQLAHTVVPVAVANLPWGHGLHCASTADVASGCAKKPAGQVDAPLHAVSPAASVYFPPAQTLQAEPVLYLPVGHEVQAEASVEPAAEKAPDGQAVQAAEPGALENLLPGHVVQLLALALGANVPAGQAVQVTALVAAINLPGAQLVQLELPASVACLPLGQALQAAVPIDVAPVAPYLPAAQAVPVHEPWTAFAVNLPAGQGVHSPAPAGANLPETHTMLHVAAPLEVAPSGPA